MGLLRWWQLLRPLGREDSTISAQFRSWDPVLRRFAQGEREQREQGVWGVGWINEFVGGLVVGIQGDYRLGRCLSSDRDCWCLSASLHRELACEVDSPSTGRLRLCLGLLPLPDVKGGAAGERDESTSSTSSEGAESRWGEHHSEPVDARDRWRIWIDDMGSLGISRE